LGKTNSSISEGVGCVVRLGDKVHQHGARDLILGFWGGIAKAFGAARRAQREYLVNRLT
jgi:hypothetical protein